MKEEKEEVGNKERKVEKMSKERKIEMEVLEKGGFGDCPQCGAASKIYKGDLVHLEEPWNPFCPLL